MATRFDLLVRVRKLLALSSSPNVHEAAAAAAAAQALIARHALDALLADDVDDPTDPITDGRQAPLQRAARPRKWRGVLAEHLAGLNGGIAWSNVDDDGVTELCFCGRASDRAAVVTLFEWLLARIEWLSATEGPGQTRQWHEAFRIGAVDAIADRLAAVDVDVDGTTARGADVLARIDARRATRAAAVDAFAALHLRRGRERNISVDRRGFAKGKAAGSAFALPKRR